MQSLRYKLHFILIVSFLLFLPVVGFTADDADYQTFGAKPGLTKIVDDFVDIVLADKRIQNHFDDSDIPRLKELLVEQFCSLTGGPCKYTGRDMKSVHKNMEVNNAQFNALAEDLQIAMEKAGISSLAQNRLIAKLAPMQKDIVTK